MNLIIKFFAIINLILFLSTSDLNATSNLEDTTTYVKIEVKGLSCPFCAYGLEKKLKEIDGATNIEIDIKEGFVTFTVAKEKQPDEALLRSVIKDAGFTAGDIAFSTTPFTTTKDEK